MKNYIAILGFAALAAIMLSVCEGPAGPQGIKGEKGEPGENGKSGADGLSITWKGTAGKSPENPELYWAYYNNVEKKSYIYDGKSWQILAQDGETGLQGPKGETGEKGDSLYLVRFNANGGAFSGGNETKNTAAEENNPVTVPEEPCWTMANFLGWYTQPAGGSLFDFTTPIIAPITLYAQWQFDKGFLVDWLMNQIGGDSEDDPINLSVNTDLDGWQELLGTIETAQKYVELDLSLCAMNGTVFNPGSGISAGKDKIISIILPDKATGIAAGSSEATSAFHGFVNLRSFSGENLAAIGAYAFCGCAKLNPDALPPGVTSIGNYSFNKCAEMALTELPSGIVTIGSYAFDGCSKLALTELPDGLTKINSYSFRNCKNLALTTLPPGITDIGTHAFDGCTNLAFTELPSTVKSILTYAFSNCSNLALTCLPENVTSIGANTFSGCSCLMQMTIHEKITSIGTNAFSGCGRLKFFTCLAKSPPTLGTDVFKKTHDELKIKVVEASLDAYKKAANWKDIADKIIEINN